MDPQTSVANSVPNSEPEDLSDFISLNDDRGVLKKVITEGTRDSFPMAGDTVYVHYVGTYHGGDQHGQKFDSSRDRKERFKFNVGKSEVIKAWDLVIPTMKIGEVCDIVAFPDYAYHDGKTLRFNIELFDFHGEDVSKEQDGSVTMSTIIKGNQVFSPDAGSSAHVSIQGCCDGKMFDERDLTYIVGDYVEAEIPKGVDVAVRQMHEGGKSIIRVCKHNSLSTELCTKYGVTLQSKLEYEVTLKSFERLKSIQSLPNFDEQIEYAEKIKNRASEFLKIGKHALAQDMYNKLLSDLLYIITDGMKQKECLDKLMIAVHLNLALSFLQEKNFSKTIEQCDKVLEFDASNEKGLFRKGQAYLLRGDHEEAIIYFKRVSKLHPENTSAVAQTKLCETMLKKSHDQERKMFRSAFKRLGSDGFKSSESPTVENGASAAEETPADEV